MKVEYKLTEEEYLAWKIYADSVAEQAKLERNIAKLKDEEIIYKMGVHNAKRIYDNLIKAIKRLRKLTFWTKWN